MSKVDFGGVKQKLLASIVAISAIQVLKAFMNIDAVFDATKMVWLVGVHLVFVISALLLALSDRGGGEKRAEWAIAGAEWLFPYCSFAPCHSPAPTRTNCFS